MTLISSYHQLVDMNKKVQTQWRQLREVWKDKNSEEFERQYIKTLERQMSASLGAIQELDELFSTIKNEFSNE